MMRGLVAVCVAAWWIAPAAADDLLISQLYGSGVHDYFAGATPQALESFERAIDLGSTDPRCFYYQGLAYLRFGDEERASEAFARGADLESRNTDRIYRVSKSLERVQGPARLKLEQYRVEARRQAQILRDAERKRRYRNLIDQMPRPPRRGPDVEPPEIAPENMPADDTAKSRAPAPAKAPTTPVPAKPAPSATPAPTPPPAPAAEENPFAEEPPADAPPEEEMPEESGDPPLGEAPPEEAPVEEEPAETPPAGGEEDPFADPPAPG